MVGRLTGGEGAKIIGADNSHSHVDVVGVIGVLRCGVESLHNAPRSMNGAVVGRIGGRDEGVGAYG